MTAARLLACVALMGLPAAAGAETPAGPLEKAEAAFEDLEFEEAAKLFREALSAPALRPERLRAYRGLGLSLAYLGDAAGARRSFEVLLLIDPQAKVRASLGPKIARPFAAARKAGAKTKRPEVWIARDAETGEVTAELSRPAAVVARLAVVVQTKEGVQRATAASPGPASLKVEPWLEAAAWAVAEDEGGGELFSAGSKEAPLRYGATARPPPAPVREPSAAPAPVAAAVDDAQRASRGRSGGAGWTSDDEALGRSVRWPLWVGGAAVAIGGGVAAAFMLRPPAPVQLPPADRTGRLP